MTKNKAIGIVAQKYYYKSNKAKPFAAVVLKENIKEEITMLRSKALAEKNLLLGIDGMDHPFAKKRFKGGKIAQSERISFSLVF